MQRASLVAELANLVGRQVTVTTTGGEHYRGTLLGISPETLSLCLGDAQDPSGKRLYRVVLNGGSVSKLIVEEVLVDLRKLAERIERVFPRMVRLSEEAGVIIVMDKIRVGEEGVIEGSGPAAEKVADIYRQFTKEQREQPG